MCEQDLNFSCSKSKVYFTLILKYSIPCVLILSNITTSTST